MKKIAFALVGIVCLSSCATVFTGTKDRIQIRSNVDSASVIRNGNTLCTTPCSIKIRRKLNGDDLEITKVGYETKFVSLETSFNAVSIINLFSLIGWGVDVLSGAVVRYDPRLYNIQLTPKK